MKNYQIYVPKHKLLNFLKLMSGVGYLYHGWTPEQAFKENDGDFPWIVIFPKGDFYRMSGNYKEVPEYTTIKTVDELLDLISKPVEPEIVITHELIYQDGSHNPYMITQIHNIDNTYFEVETKNIGYRKFKWEKILELKKV
jgi:hypothetical protein